MGRSTSNELDVQNEWEENTHTHTHTEDQCEWHRMTRMTGPDCVVMCNLINTHTHTSPKPPSATQNTPLPCKTRISTSRLSITLSGHTCLTGLADERISAYRFRCYVAWRGYPTGCELLQTDCIDWQTSVGTPSHVDQSLTPMFCVECVDRSNSRQRRGCRV